MSAIIAAPNSWTLAEAKSFSKENPDIKIITNKNELTRESLAKINPEYVFFPHWSWIIPSNIYENFNCVVFHPSDLPFGRGGTPIQNLINLGYTDTVISAIKVIGELDAGDVYTKRQLSLLGGGEEILIRMQKIIFREMIPAILNNNIIPIPQLGKVTTFKRRVPHESEILPNMDILKIFDQIRMLDIESYPKAYIRFGDYKITFSRAALKTDGIYADVKICKEYFNDNRK